MDSHLKRPAFPRAAEWHWLGLAYHARETGLMGVFWSSSRRDGAMAKPTYRALGVALRIFSVLLAVVLGTIRTLWIAP